MERLNRIFLNPFIPLLFRVGTLISVIALIIIAWPMTSDEPSLLKVLRNTNLSTLLVWSYWWPLLVISALMFGRLWCLACPVELLVSLLSRLGLKRKPPVFITKGWIITITYILILSVGIRVLQIHRNPRMLAWYLISLILLAVISSMLFQKNTFCRYMCPIGYLLGIYARFSFLGWRVKDKKACQACSDKSCVQKNYLYQPLVKSCGVDLYPGTLSDNDTCILCTGCMKVCDKNRSSGEPARPNPGFRYIGFGKDFFSLRSLTWSQAIFVFVLSGFVIYEILSEFAPSKTILLYLPQLIKQKLTLSNSLIIGLEESFFLFFLFPFIVWCFPHFLARFIGIRMTLKRLFLNYSLSLLPIMATAHVCKALLKMTSRIPYFEYVMEDPLGKKTALALLKKEITLNSLPHWVEYAIACSISVLLLFGFALSLKVIFRLNKKYYSGQYKAHILLILPCLYGSIFLVTVLFWKWLI